MVQDIGTVDGANGTVDVWIDGTKCISYTGIAMRLTSDDTLGDPEVSRYGIFGLSWVPVFTSSVAKDRTDTAVIDNIYVSGVLDANSPGPG